MNLALPALIVFIVLLPGFVFRSGLKRAESVSLDFSPFGRVVAESVLWAAILHCAWIILSALFGYRFDPVVLMGMLSAHPARQADAAGIAADQFLRISVYFGSLLVVANLAPVFIRHTISAFRLDRESARFGSIFRFYDAPWHYLLTGADFERDDAPDLIYVSAIVEVAKEAVLYVGVLNDFYFDKDGQLDRLILQNVKRRPISADKDGAGAAPERFYPVDGDNFVLRYSEAVTLNIQYVKLTPADAG